jgi:hypothetical protein
MASDNPSTFAIKEETSSPPPPWREEGRQAGDLGLGLGLAILAPSLVEPGLPGELCTGGDFFICRF